MRYGVIDLFSGAGGLSLGAARAGFKVYGAVEIDPHAMDTHKRNFPGTIHLEEDISTLTGSGLSAFLRLNGKRLAGVIGGPPCQGFSYIGKRNIDDHRNNLFADFFRIVADVRPVFFLAENVPGILDKSNDSIREEALSKVESEYTFLPPMILKASDYGAPTLRTRVFFYGYLKDEMAALTPEDFIPADDVEQVCVKDALRGLPTKIHPQWQSESQGWRRVRVYGDGYYAVRLHGHIPDGVSNPIARKRLTSESLASGSLGTKHMPDIVARYAQIPPGGNDAVSRAQRLELNGFCPTLRAGTGRDHGSYQAVRPIHPTQNRVITPREAARLQGFPDWFQFSPTKWHSFRQIGSSVSPIIAERILSVINKALD